VKVCSDAYKPIITRITKCAFVPASKKSLLHCTTPTDFVVGHPCLITSYSLEKNLKTRKSWKWARPDNKKKWLKETKAAYNMRMKCMQQQIDVDTITCYIIYKKK
jgi:hypothetical protein